MKWIDERMFIIYGEGLDPNLLMSCTGEQHNEFYAQTELWIYFSEKLWLAVGPLRLAITLDRTL